MKHLNKLAVAISAASAVMLGISQAQAFDESKWKWDLDVKTDVDQYIDIDVDDLGTPTGLGLIEINQTFNGSVKAVSTVTDVGIDAGGKDGHDEHRWDFWGDKNGGPEKPKVDVELGAVESAATAVANNASLDTTVMTDLDSNQIWNGSGEVKALSLVAHVDNMTVDSSATAVGNNLSVSLVPTTVDTGDANISTFGGNHGGGGWPGSGGDDMNIDPNADNVLLANINQVGTGDVSAYSFVHDINLGGTSDLTVDGVQVPEISSVATAVGNNVSLKLGGDATNL